MKIHTAFHSKWIRAADLQGREYELTIARFLQEDITGDGTLKPVVYFQATDKGLVLNKVNSETIAGLYGEETDDWAGRTITLYPTTTDFKGKRVDCLRVRENPSPPAAAPVSSPPADDEIPF